MNPNSIVIFEENFFNKFIMTVNELIKKVV
jgi:hypothetical protein